MLESTNVTELVDQNFDNIVLNSDIPVLVDFWASWCGPCKLIAPIIEELSEEYQGIVSVYKVNAETELDTVKEYSVRALPTIMLFNNGKVVFRHAGLKTKADLIEEIKKLIETDQENCSSPESSS